MITIPNAEVAHRRLLQAFDTMFTEYEGCLYYSHPGGKQIKVDFSTNCRVSDRSSIFFSRVYSRQIFGD